MNSLVREKIFKKEGLYITNHAKERLEKRFGINYDQQFNFIKDAFINGKKIKSYAITKSRYFYKDMVFVFSWNRLITIYDYGKRRKL